MLEDLTCWCAEKCCWERGCAGAPIADVCCVRVAAAVGPRSRSRSTWFVGGEIHVEVAPHDVAHLALVERRAVEPVSLLSARKRAIQSSRRQSMCPCRRRTTPPCAPRRRAGTPVPRGRASRLCGYTGVSSISVQRLTPLLSMTCWDSGTRARLVARSSVEADGAAEGVRLRSRGRTLGAREWEMPPNTSSSLSGITRPARRRASSSTRDRFSPNRPETGRLGARIIGGGAYACMLFARESARLGRGRPRCCASMSGGAGVSSLSRRSSPPRGSGSPGRTFSGGGGAFLRPTQSLSVSVSATRCP